MKREVKIVIPGELPDLNQYTLANRTHRIKGADMKKGAEQIVTYSIMRSMPLRDFEPIQKAHITFHWKAKDRRKDPDNIAFAKKFILDALVANGVLKNDTWKCISGFTDVFDTDKINPCIVVTVTEL